MHVFLVTNAGTEAAYQIARDLLRAGHRVVVTATHATTLVRIMHGYGPDRVLAIAADTTDLEQVRRLVSRAESQFGSLDFVVTPDGVSRRFKESTLLRLVGHLPLAVAS
jgi:NAD(P)-dependent dehydrogenase (short-subunit alcohol dehydrogenase family)